MDCPSHINPLNFLAPLGFSMLSFELTFLCSTIFHWFGPVSKRVMNITKRLDYSMAMSSSFLGPFSIFYYNYYDRYLVVLLVFVVGFSLNLMCFVLNLGEWIHLRKHYFLKVMVFSIAGVLCVFVPNVFIFGKR